MRLYWPRKLHPAFDALLDIDDALGDVVVRSTQPALGAVKLAWWRERLGALDVGMVPSEPRLQAASAQLLPRGVSGKDLAGLESGWAELLAEQPETDRALARGDVLFAIGATLLGAHYSPLMGAGRLYSAGTLYRRALGAPGAVVVTDLPKIPRSLRPLTALAALAARDLRRGGPPFEPEATPARAWALLRHRVTGRL